MHFRKKINDFLKKGDCIFGKKRFLLKKRHHGSIVEQALIVATIVAAAIVGLGYLGLAVQKQLGVLAGSIKSGTEVIEGEAEATESPSIGDPSNAAPLYYQCKDSLLAFAANSEYAEHSGDRAAAFYDGVWNDQIMLPYSNTLSDDELYYLGQHAISVLGDPPGASEAYEEHKQALVDIYNSDDTALNKRNAINSYYENITQIVGGGSFAEQSYLHYIVGIVGDCLMTAPD